MRTEGTTQARKGLNMTTNAQRLKYRSSLYELVAENDGRRVLVAYAKKGRNNILKSVRNRAEIMVALTGSEAIDFAKRAVAQMRGCR